MRPDVETSENRGKSGRLPDWLRWAALCARIALGAAFLSGIADRFGLYRGEMSVTGILQALYATRPK
jgi:hypothetical protein